MKQKTFDKYEQFLRLLNAKNVYDLGFQQRKYKIADSFISFLKKNKYLERMAGGSYKLIDCPLGFKHIVNEYKKATEKKPVEIAYPNGNAPTLVYCDVNALIKALGDAPALEREQAAIAILGSIMRDNQHITYDLIRNERKETKTDLLKR